MKPSKGWRKLDSGTITLKCPEHGEWGKAIRFLSQVEILCPVCGRQGEPVSVDKKGPR